MSTPSGDSRPPAVPATPQSYYERLVDSVADAIVKQVAAQLTEGEAAAAAEDASETKERNAAVERVLSHVRALLSSSLLLAQESSHQRLVPGLGTDRAALANLPSPVSHATSGANRMSRNNTFTHFSRLLRKLSSNRCIAHVSVTLLLIVVPLAPSVQLIRAIHYWSQEPYIIHVKYS